MVFGRLSSVHCIRHAQLHRRGRCCLPEWLWWLKDKMIRHVI